MIAGIKRVVVALLLIAILGAVLHYGRRWYDASRDVQSTDDAYIRAEVTDVSPRVTGYAVEVLVDDNMPVKAKQPLVRIDSRDFRVNVEKSQATLDQANASVAQVEASRQLEISKITVAEAVQRSAEAQAKNAELTLSRATELLAKGAGTQATFDAMTAAEIQARSAVDQAVANLAYEREQLAVIDANEAVARAQVDSAKAALASATIALEDMQVWAPIAGIVADRKTRVGEFVVAGSKMLSIVPLDNLWIEANYRETQIGQMKVSDPVRVDLDSYPGKPLCGYVQSIAPASGSEFALIPPDNATGNFTKIVRRFTVRIRFNAREPNIALARAGMSVETAVSVSTSDADTPGERGRRVGCAFDPGKDIIERPLTKLPDHPGLSHASP